MSSTKKPWWLLVNKPAGLVTTIQDRSVPGERAFVIHGQPVVQGLNWLTCGPVGALLAIALLTGLAVATQGQEMSGVARFLFVVAFLGLPALVWGLIVVGANKASAKHLQAIQDSETQTCVIRLKRKQGKLFYKNANTPAETGLNYEQIHRVHVTPAIGGGQGKSMYLLLETDEGSVVLLNEMLGTHPQKADLCLVIETSLQNYAENKNPPSN